MADAGVAVAGPNHIPLLVQNVVAFRLSTGQHIYRLFGIAAVGVCMALCLRLTALGLRTVLYRIAIAGMDMAVPFFLSAGRLRPALHLIAGIGVCMASALSLAADGL